jgi:hypothetical protein
MLKLSCHSVLGSGRRASACHGRFDTALRAPTTRDGLTRGAAITTGGPCGTFTVLINGAACFVGKKGSDEW